MLENPHFQAKITLHSVPPGSTSFHRTTFAAHKPTSAMQNTTFALQDPISADRTPCHICHIGVPRGKNIEHPPVDPGSIQAVLRLWLREQTHWASAQTASIAPPYPDRRRPRPSGLSRRLQMARLELENSYWPMPCRPLASPGGFCIWLVFRVRLFFGGLPGLPRSLDSARGRGWAGGSKRGAL